MPVSQPDEALQLFLDLAPETDTMGEDVWAGLNASPPWLPSKYFYDTRGSQLFDRICELDEYYPTRTEAGILKRILPELNTRFEESLIMLEYGSGSSTKTQLLLEHLNALDGYVPIDISKDHLLSTGKDLIRQFPDLNILPVCADYGQRIPFDWTSPRLGTLSSARRMVFFPGSTIGNFTRATASTFLKRMAELLGSGGYLLIGVDLVKDDQVLHAAYNDAEGVTAAFNKNILRHINRRLNTDFDLQNFEHEAIWDPVSMRIEMRLNVLQSMEVHLRQGSIVFDEGSFIRTEYSHKYQVESFAELSRESGFEVRQVWTDENEWFSVQLLQAT